ncbi:hypothetical protein SAMN05421640_3593 [Ekhidna lutea]|uniref:Uncharacterized protein n=1 Tax=Ekhidna lutea TaxID=447679 RepID=A0A239M2A8_EKHLU|nr:hypothetical protein [Ekhidna lutea]SNT36811.1 hypothetical protein SAMN05421640_3593 [Ekhidna lutea]
MKTIRLIIAGMLLCASVDFTYAQSFDEERMDRDLKIAENILSTLARGESRSIFYDNVESNYIQDYGVIFSIPQSTFVFKASGSSVVYRSSGGGSAVVVAPEAPEPDDEERRVIEDKRRVEIKGDELAELAEENLREQMTTFLVDYADLIGQLKPSDRIIVQTSGKNDRIFVSGRNSVKKQSGLTAQILKSDLIAFKQGKLDRSEVIGKISFTSNENKEVAKDLELFATIFARLYEPDLSSTYYMSSRSIGYTNLEGYGVTFSMKMYSSTSDGGIHTIRTTGETGLSQEERNEKVNAMYPQFEQTFKENLLDYGRTIRSMKPEEMLTFKVKLTECRGCEMPEEIEVSVKGEVLKGYDSGSLSKESALKKISVTKKRD